MSTTFDNLIKEANAYINSASPDKLVHNFMKRTVATVSEAKTRLDQLEALVNPIATELANLSGNEKIQIIVKKVEAAEPKLDTAAAEVDKIAGAVESATADAAGVVPAAAVAVNVAGLQE